MTLWEIISYAFCAFTVLLVLGLAVGAAMNTDDD